MQQSVNKGEKKYSEAMVSEGYYNDFSFFYFFFIYTGKYMISNLMLVFVKIQCISPNIYYLIGYRPKGYTIPSLPLPLFLYNCRK